MNPYKISLPANVLAELYTNSLVVIDNEIYPAGQNSDKAEIITGDEMISVSNTVVKTPYKAPGATLNYLGDNRKHITIVVRDEQAIHLQDDHLQVLSAILGACRFNLADVAIVNTHRQEVTDSSLRQHLSPECVLLFGLDTSEIELPFSIPEYHIQHFSNCKYVQSASFTKMTGNSAEAKLQKSKLWVTLQQLFGI